jgi:hypothetical protein
MRTDLNRYFAETTVHSVLGVKFFGDGKIGSMTSVRVTAFIMFLRAQL